MQKVTDKAMKWDNLLVSCGSTTLGLVKTLATPDNIKGVQFDWLIEILTAHFAPQPTKLTRRVTFYNRERKPQELAMEFLAAPQKLDCKLNFQGLNQALLDQFT